MIYLKLKAGRANQLFQFGAALRLAGGDVSQIRLISPPIANGTDCLSDLFPAQRLPDHVNPEEIDQLRSRSPDIIEIRDSISGPFADQGGLDCAERAPSMTYFLDGHFHCGLNLIHLRNYLGAVEGIGSMLHARGAAPSRKRVVAHYWSGKLPDVEGNSGVVDLSYLDRIFSKYLSQTPSVHLCSDADWLANKYKHNRKIVVQTSGNEMDTLSELLQAAILIITNSAISMCAAFLSESLQELYRPALWARGRLVDDLSRGFERPLHLVPNAFY